MKQVGLQINSVYKKYDNKQVLSGINVSVEDGTFLALLGPSGCGKTTLLQTIAGLTPIDGGQILIDNQVVSQAGYELPTEKRNIGMVFQDFALWPHMTVYENVAFGLKLRGVKGAEARQRVQETLGIFHMESYITRFPHELSGGQKQRVAMARAIAPKPRLILMDEPLSSLDAGLRDEMRSELARIFKQLGMTVVYVTHDQLEALSMADQIAVMRTGQCEQYGTPEQVYHEPVSDYVAKFMGPATIVRVNAEYGWFVRPDDIQLQRVDSADSPASSESDYQTAVGIVALRSYQGNRYRYFVNVPEYQTPIEVNYPAKLQPGERVRLLFPTVKCRPIRLINEAGSTPDSSVSV
ncbi:MAG: Iron(III) transport system ATP-binding protein/spermidine/putrescine transport system ATP-binding [Bacilli bacterium]|nr:Iron(III) transport system ATP-binding protein/spermidine/putrescine transport system ATP-binding [Bacilli bacterium]